MGEKANAKESESTEKSGKELGSVSETSEKFLATNSQRKPEESNINSPSGGYKNQINRDVVETSPVIKSRYGRTHKPKIPEDFLPTDKKVAAILGHSPHKSPVKSISTDKKAGTGVGHSPNKSPVKFINSSPNNVAKVCQKGRKVYDIFTKRERTSKGNRELEENKIVFNEKEGLSVKTEVTDSVKESTLVRTNSEGREENYEKSPRKSNLILDESLTVSEWKVGDLAWARVSGYPFWPCMIALDPEQGIYLKSNVRGTFTLHVQFFGDNGRRSWLFTNCVIPFEGLDALNRLSAKLQNEAKKRDKKLVAAFHVGPKAKTKWDIAVMEAEEAMQMSRASRLQDFATRFPHDPSKKKKTDNSFSSPNEKNSSAKLNKSPSPAKSKSGRQSAVGCTSSPHRSPSKVKQENDDYCSQSPSGNVDSETEISPTRKSDAASGKKKNQCKKYRTASKPLRGDFNLYLYKNLDRVSQEYPELDEKSVEKYLAKEWKNMDNEQKSKYCARMNTSEMVVGSPDTSSYEDEDEEEEERGEEEEEAEGDDEEEEEEEEEETEAQSSDDKLQKTKTESSKTASRYALKKGGGLFRGTKQEKVCQICEKPGDTVKCRGPCCGSFHLDCVPKLVAEGRTTVEVPSEVKEEMKNTTSVEQEVNDPAEIENTNEEKNSEVKEPVLVTSVAEKLETSIKEVEKVTLNGIIDIGNNISHKEFQKKRKRHRSGDNSGSDSESESKATKRRKSEKTNNEEMEDTDHAEADEALGGVNGIEHTTRGSSSDKENVVEEECNRTQERAKFENEVMLSSELKEAEKLLTKNKLDDTINTDSGKTKLTRLSNKKEKTKGSEKELRNNPDTIDMNKKEEFNKKTEVKSDEKNGQTESQFTPNERPKRVLRHSLTKKEVVEVKSSKSDKDKNRDVKSTPQEKDEKKDKKIFSKKKEKNEKGKDYEIEEKSQADNVPEFRCPDCELGQSTPCFACGRRQELKSGNEQRQRCAIGHCGKFYHAECLKLWPHAWSSGGGASRRQAAAAARGQELAVVTCPQHVCHTCASDDPRNITTRFNHERLVRCIRCPTAYHTGNYCLPAGSEVLTGSQIICPKHYKPPQKKTYHVNAAWCFICAMGGSLICCDLCPTSFHAECLNISAPEGSFICEDCDTGRFPLYGEIVWVKLGAYRWWPAQILYPNQIPNNILNLPHVRGEFAVRFFGSHDHYWVNRGRVFLYQEGDTGHSTSRKSYMEGMFSRALLEASEAHKTLKGEKATRDAEARPVMKPPMYVKIKSNKPVGNVRVMEMDPASMTPCDCDPKSENPCGPETDCLNRILLVECSPSVCLAGEKCGNQCFEKRQYPPLVPYKTETRGWGLQTLADIRKGDFVIEYVGEMIDETEYQRRMSRKHEEKDENYYFLTIDKDRMLDAGPKGNVSRFMNHSCQPNCETQKWTVNGDTRVGLFALEDIPAGTELTFNYNLECAGTDKKPCMCGAPNCSGFIGIKATKQQSEEDKKPRMDQQNLAKRRKKRRSDAKGPSDDLCFICGEGGQLLLCDNKTCPKGYHLQCLKLKNSPQGKWLCPWHRCNECNKRTIRRCSYCPNSYCPCHSEDNIRLHPTRGLVCKEHYEVSGVIKEELVEPVLEEKMDVEGSDPENTSTVVKETQEEDIKEHTNNKDSEFPSIGVQDIREKSTKCDTPNADVVQDDKEGSIKDPENAVSEENMSLPHSENSNSSLNDSGVLKRKRGRPRKSTTEEREDETNSIKNTKKLPRIERRDSENSQSSISVNSLTEEPVKRVKGRSRSTSIDTASKPKVEANSINSEVSDSTVKHVEETCGEENNINETAAERVDNLPLQGKDSDSLHVQTKCNETKDSLSEVTTVNGIETPGIDSLPVER